MKADPTHRPLTERQREVIAMSADGLEVNQIAEVLNIAPSTVKVHVYHALQRLKAHNRTHAVAILLREGTIL